MKKIVTSVVILILLGCSFPDDGTSISTTETSEANCILKEKENTISIELAYNNLINKLENSLAEGVEIESSGISVFDKRVYYTFRKYVIVSCIGKSITGNYAVDIYTGNVYDTDLGEYIKLD